MKAIFEEKFDIVQSESDKAFLFTKLNELNDKIVNFTIEKLEHLEPVSDLKKETIRNKVEKLYNAAIQTEQIASEEKEINRIKDEMFEIYIQYSQNLLNGSEPDLLQMEEDNNLETSKARAINIEFTRKYFGGSINDLPGNEQVNKNVKYLGNQ